MWFVFGTALWVSGFEVCGSGVLLSSAKGRGSFSGNRVHGGWLTSEACFLAQGCSVTVPFVVFCYSNAS